MNDLKDEGCLFEYKKGREVFKMKNKKRGELTTTMLVTIILLIVGFGLILFVYTQLGWTGEVDREVCHQSVIMRGTLPGSYGLKEYAPLKCSTEKNCIGENCEKLKDVPKKEVNKIKINDVGDIERFVSQDIIDCWTMMGEGKISIFSNYMAENYGLGQVYPTCVICSRIAFDDNLELDSGKIGDANILKYMLTHKMPEQDISYYEFLAKEKGEFSIKDDGTLLKNGVNIEEYNIKLTEEKIGELNNFEGSLGLELTEICKEAEKKAKEQGKTLDVPECIKNLNENLKSGELKNSVENKEIAVLFMQISSPGNLDSLKNLARDLAIGGTAGHFMSFGLTTKMLSKIPAPIAVIIGGTFIAGQQASVLWNRYFVTAGYCGDISTGENTRDGCSVVRIVNYDIDDIKQYCSVIESIP